MSVRRKARVISAILATLLLGLGITVATKWSKTADVGPENVNAFEFEYQAAQTANQNVIFFGQCIDQYGDPVPGVRIQANLTQMKSSRMEILITGEYKDYIDLETTSDEHGRFSFINTGSYLLFQSVRKEGYILDQRAQGSFQFGQLLYGSAMSGMHKADPANPVVYHMWKKGEPAESLKVRDKQPFSFSAKVDDHNIIHSFNLVTNRLTKNKAIPGSIHITTHNANRRHRDPETRKISGELRDYEWFVRFELAKGGGFIETDDKFLFLAPETGYEPSWTFKMEKDAKDWVPKKRHIWLYVKTPDGMYGSIKFSLHSNPIGSVRLHFDEIIFNPTGSRNLQPK